MASSATVFKHGYRSNVDIAYNSTRSQRGKNGTNLEVEVSIKLRGDGEVDDDPVLGTAFINSEILQPLMHDLDFSFYGRKMIKGKLQDGVSQNDVEDFQVPVFGPEDEDQKQAIGYLSAKLVWDPDS